MPTYTDVLSGPTSPVPPPPSAVCTDPLYASRSATKMYRTTPLRALWQHPLYFHDGSASSLLDVVNHYNTQLSLRPGGRAEIGSRRVSQDTVNIVAAGSWSA